ncbi:MAG: malonic semialdehyde reductase [Actinobacteria bacterium]|nr:malonic semialdehyde reductase [Actinomycetota bacterium]MDA2960745.1 malonic semialdehyde reductase [Actinomycetota bacterium]MDA2994394.1 malonic semialdehyde reductase [Actinomycetota bacterium]
MSSPISESDISQLFVEAHTAKTFLNEPVTDAQIEAIYEMLKWAPTTMNIQPLRLILGRSEEARAQILQHLSGSNREQAEAAPLVTVVCADTNFHDTLNEVVPHIANAREFFLDDARREATARHQTWLQSGYLILAIRALGLGCGPMLGYDAAGLDDSMLKGSGLVSTMVMTIGVPDPAGYGVRRPRLDLDRVMLER